MEAMEAMEAVTTTNFDEVYGYYKEVLRNLLKNL